MTRSPLSWIIFTLLLLPACIEKESLGKLDLLGESTTDSGGLTDGATSDATGPEEPGATTGGTTGVPAGCPEGQPPGTLLWEVDVAELMSSLGFAWSFDAPMQRLADGRVLLPVSLSSGPEKGAGMFVVSPAGEFLGVEHAPLTAGGGATVTGLVIDPNDQRYTVGERGNNEGSNWTELTHYAADGAVIARHTVEFLDPGTENRPSTIALTDMPVVGGLDAASNTTRLGKIDPATGVPVWTAVLAESATEGEWPPLIMAIAAGPSGEVVVAAQAISADDVSDWFADTIHLWQFTGDGAEVWHRELTVPVFSELTDLQYTPGGDLLLLRGGPDDEPSRVQLLAVAGADGSTLWQQTVATSNAERGKPWAEQLHIEGDAVTVPITWSPAADHLTSSNERALTIHRLSLAGEPLSDVALLDPMVGLGSSETYTLLGDCGELVVLAVDEGPIYIRAHAQ